jgi:cytochrome c peroxidase
VRTRHASSFQARAHFPIREPSQSRRSLRSLACLTLSVSSLAAGAPPAQPHELASAQPTPLAPSPAPGLTPIQQLGKNLFFDATLSNPAGQSCSSCHAPSAGFTFPDSRVNQSLGVAPGAKAGRFGFRAVPQMSYSAFNPPGPPHYNPLIELYVGGQFWDGRAADLVEQAQEPFVNPNEMNNLTHNLADPALVVQKVRQGASATLFKQVFGSGVFQQPPQTVYEDIATAISTYEQSIEVSPFSSKYDAWKAGKAELSDQELLGMRLMTGTYSGRPDGATFPINVHCAECHMIPSVPSGSPDLWTNTCYQNIGVPRNPQNPFYKQTNSQSNPVGYNPLGQAFVDLGLGGSMYPSMGLPPGNMGEGSDGNGDFLGINGQFKAPSLRNVDKRPSPSFVKAYMHNGVFKSIEQVVHFYNTRNLTTHPGEVVDFTKDKPYQGLIGKPLWPVPEYPSLDTLLNPDGVSGLLPGTGPGGESGAQVGNLGMTAHQEAAVVAFLKTLSDGYFQPDRTGCLSIVSQPVSQPVCMGGSVQMTVACAVPPRSYQWRLNGVPIPGAIHSFYSIGSAIPGNAGVYDCVITADCGTVTSRAATLSVCLADFTCDGQVNRDDVNAYLEAFMARDPIADLNGDGIVNIHDLLLFWAAFRHGC